MRERGPPPRPRRARVRVLGGIVLCAVLSVFTRAVADGPAQLLCRAERIGERARAEVTVVDLFDRDLLHLVRLGLEGRIAVEAVLYRRRPLWFDRRQAVESRTSLVTWSRGRGAFALDGQPLPDPQRVTLPPVVLRPLADGSHYLEISVRLEVVTAGSLVQVARWLVRGQGGEGPTPSLLGRSLLSQVAADLARTASSRCPVR
jgi:hypothetical protein